MPEFARGCEGHVLIGMTEDVNNIAELAWLPPLAAKARIAVRTNGREPMATLAAAGIGIACLPRFLGDATPGLRALSTPTPPPERALWLGVHRAARSTPRIRVTLDFLRTSFERLRPALRP
jgi:DNA-binding transcriptional LysR family regulator